MSTGLLYGVAAYGMWGAFPLYFPLLEPASPLEIVAHRVVWSLVFCVLAISVVRGWGRVVAVFRERRRLTLLSFAAVMIAINWGVYIAAVNSAQVVEASLGYFINPLLSVALAVIVLRERLRRLQWVAVGIASIAVLILTVGYGRPPWIALVLASSFGLYGLAKKVAGVDALPSLTVETAVLAPICLAYLGWLQATGELTFGDGLGHTALLMSAGVITALPLLAFAAATNRIPLSSIGLLQYITPVLQFLIGVTIAGEHMPAVRWWGFAVVWVALIVFSIDALRAGRTRTRADAFEVVEQV